MYQVNAAHTGYVPIDVDPQSFSLRWQKSVSASQALNPVAAADGRVFVSLQVYFNAGPALFALNAADGAELWNMDFGSVFSVNPPSVAGGKVYLQTGKGTGSGAAAYLRAYDAATGTTAFRTQYSAQWESHLAPTLYAGKAYVNGGYYGGMYSYDGTAGAQQWFFDLPQVDRWTPAVDGEYAYAFLEGMLYVIDRVGGTEAFRIDDPGSSSGGGQTAPVLGTLGNVLVTSGARLVSFDLVGRRIGYEVQGGFTGQPALAGGVVYCIASGALSARDEATGALLWSWSAPAALTGNLVVTHSHVFARTATDTYAIDLATHESVWTYPVSGHLALGNETLYIAGANGTLTAIGLASTVVPEPPVLGRIGPHKVLEGSALAIELFAEDSNGDALSYGYTGQLPAGATFDATTRTFSWVPVHEQVGTHEVTFSVTDGALSDEETVVIEVVPVGDSVAWPMHQANAAHTGYVPLDLDPAKFLFHWEHAFERISLNPVSAAEGKVFVSHTNNVNGSSLFALKATDGAELWNKAFGDVFSVNPPTYGAGKVYVQTGNHSSDTYLRGYSAGTGDVVFRAPHGAQWERYLAPTFYGGNAYVNGGMYGGMYGFNGTSGAQLWFNDSLPQVEEWTPAVDSRYAYAFLSENHPTLYAVERATGTLAFSIEDADFSFNGRSAGSAPVIAGDGSLLGIVGGRLYRFDVAGRRIAYGISGGFAGQPAVAHGVVYAVQSGALSARDLATGNQLWMWEAPQSAPLWNSIVVTHSHVFVRTETMTYAVDLSTHQAVWSYPRAGQLTVGNSDLYIAGGDGVLTAIALSPTAFPEPPVLAAAAGVSATEGKRVTFALVGLDPNGDALTYEALDPLPPGATLSAASGVFTWMPGFDQAGVYTLRFRAVDSGAPPLFSAPVSVTLRVRNPTGRIFFDNFSRGVSARNWKRVAGTWTGGGGVYTSTSMTGTNISRVVPLDPVKLPLGAGVIQAKIMLNAAAGGGAPNGMIIFGYRDAAHYRWVKLTPAEVILGQTGTIGGVSGGEKRRIQRRQTTGKFALVTVKVYRDGWVRVLVDSASPLLSYRFVARKVPSVVKGGVGIGSSKARTVFDDVAVREDSALGR